MADASSNVDTATGTSPTADVQQDIWSLSPQEAGEILQQAAVQYHQQQAPLTPTTARDAELRLAQLSADGEWYRKLMAGDMTVRQEFDRLTALKAGAATSDPLLEQFGETTIGEGLSRRDLISAAEDMRADGFPDAAIEHILADGKFTAETVRDAQYWLPRMLRDPSLLAPDLPPDREYQLKVWRTIAAIGTMDTP
jgi:hypothetical protein